MKKEGLKFKYLNGDTYKEKFDGIELSSASSESAFVRSNGLYTAIPWKTGGGGVLALTKAFEFKKFNAQNVKLLKGHQGAVIDFDFSPF